MIHKLIGGLSEATLAQSIDSNHTAWPVLRGEAADCAPRIYLQKVNGAPKAPRIYTDAE